MQYTVLYWQGWLLDGGSVRGRLAEMLLTFVDILIGQDTPLYLYVHHSITWMSPAGEENYLFLKYLFWFRLNARHIGGWHNWPYSGGLVGGAGPYQPPLPSSLETHWAGHTETCPKVD